ncbi:MAG: hypothetical protein HOW73_26490 [Polyangiaceae bacterium]|nr:hypothetical protein [Polyangiaceae bacterium]
MRRASCFRAAVLLAFAAGWTACGSVRGPVALKGPAASGAVSVAVDAPKGVELWREEASSAPGEPSLPVPVCAAPCAAEVLPGGARFQARVIDMPDSPPFDIPKTSRGAIVRVEPAPPVLPGLGAVTGTVGAAAMVIGGVFVAGDAFEDDGLEDIEGDEGDFNDTALPGGIMIVAGGAVLAAGIVLAALSGTHVQIKEATRARWTVSF